MPVELQNQNRKRTQCNKLPECWNTKSNRTRRKELGAGRLLLRQCELKHSAAEGTNNTKHTALCSFRVQRTMTANVTNDSTTTKRVWANNELFGGQPGGRWVL